MSHVIAQGRVQFKVWWSGVRHGVMGIMWQSPNAGDTGPGEDTEIDLLIPQMDLEDLTDTTSMVSL